MVRLKNELVESYLEINNVNKRAFCKRCKIAPSTLHKFLTNDSIGVLQMSKIAKVLKMQILELFEDTNI